jgi:hypothetical protein
MNSKIDSRLEGLQKYIISYGLQEYALKELELFKKHISEVIVDSERSYSASFKHLVDRWYDFLHNELHVTGFVNGEPQENTWEKRPKACLWWEVYAFEPRHWRPYYDHHCSSKERQEQMLNCLDDIISCLKQRGENI